MNAPPPLERFVLVLLVLLPAAVKLVLAGRWGLLADEAYYAAWARQPAVGYHDQPPLIAWVLAPLWSFRSDVLLRAPGIVAGLLATAAMLSLARDRVFVATWWAAVLPLAWLTGFATPDAYLVATWAGTIAAAARGGKGWYVAGLLGALAGLSKHSGLAVFPLAVVALREREALGGAVVWALILLPHAIWLATHDALTVRFQAVEGLLHPHPPGLGGPLAVIGQQAAILTPLLFVAALLVWRQGPGTDRIQRLAWWTSAPIALFFLVAALGGPPEAHWLAPCWVGVGLLLDRARGRLARLTWTGLGVSLFASLLLALHGEIGVFRLRVDPRDRLREGEVLAQSVAAWALPAGVGMRERGVERAVPVVTERYQEAALIWWYAGIETQRAPTCGRADQYTLHAEELPERFYFVRPSRGGPLTCTGPTVGRHPLVGQTLGGDVVGRWDLFEVQR